MGALESLYEDHRHIYRALDALDAATRPALAQGRVDAAFFEQAAAFFRDYADGLHHKKEEELLFPAMEAQRIPGVEHPLRCMNLEHEAGRALVRRIAVAAAGLREGKQEQQPELVMASTQYIGLLRVHANKEDQGLFQMAERLLPADVQQRLQDQFQAIDASPSISIAQAAAALTERAARLAPAAGAKRAEKSSAVAAPPVAFRMVEPPLGADPHLARALAGLGKR